MLPGVALTRLLLALRDRDLRLIVPEGRVQAVVADVSLATDPSVSTTTATSRSGRAIKLAATVAARPGIVVLQAASDTMNVVACTDADRPPASAPLPVWVRDDGTIAVLTPPDFAVEASMPRLDIFDGDGARHVNIDNADRNAKVIVERTNLTVVAPESGAGAVVEIDLDDCGVRRLAQGHVTRVASAATGCLAALALGCETWSALPYAGPRVDRQVYRFGHRGPVPEMLDPC